MLTHYKSSVFGVTVKATVVWLIVMLIGELVAGISKSNFKFKRTH